MKKRYAALLALFPASLIAQPVLNVPLDYEIGAWAKYVPCQPKGAGNAGANQTWNFSSLTLMPGEDSITLSYLSPNSGNPFPTANLLQKSSRRSYQYINKTPTENNMVGLLDSSLSYTVGINYSNSVKLGVRPVTYLATYTDAFAEAITVSGAVGSGSGNITVTVDGYGTLQLPNATYSNVLRVKAVMTQNDVLTGLGSINTKQTSYFWFDNNHRAPLMSVDSLQQTSPFGNTNTQLTQYLQREHYPSSVESMNAKRVKFTGAFTANSIALNGAFDAAKPYEVKLYSLSGQVIYNTTFKGSANNQTFNMNSDIAAGVYLLSVMEAGNSASSYAIRLVK